MPTELQKQLVKKLPDNKFNVSKTAKKVGYSDATAHNPQNLIRSKGFQQALAEIDDTKITDRWYKWALKSKDKRVALEAGKEIMKLKNRYPKEKIDLDVNTKLNGLFKAE